MSAGAAESRKVALVTGGTDGIGRATVKRLLTEGWEVVFTARSRERAEATLSEMRSSTGRDAVSYLPADLSRMKDVKAAAESFLKQHARLDLLLLNANSISQERKLTEEGLESNMAIGYFGRALLLWSLEQALSATPGAQVLSVVGLNLDRLDFEDPTLSKGFSAGRALGKWQWANQVFVREHNRRGKTPMNVFQPGLVRTKILSNEPQPMRALVQVMNWIIGIAPERSAGEVLSVVNEVARAGIKDEYFSRAKRKGLRDLKSQPGDGERLWTMTEEILRPYLK